ncbi:MAG: Alanine racemase [Holosporales bacterium]
MPRTAYAILSTQNLIHNVHEIKKRVHDSKIIAMVKANAYGHGLRSVSMRLDSHVDAFGVAAIDEALALRKVHVKKPILLMEGIFERSECLIASTEGFEIVIHNQQQLDWCIKSTHPLKVWIKVDTGLGRLGIPHDMVHKFYQDLKNADHIHPEIGILSHFACADIKDHPLNQKQIDMFLNIKKTCDAHFSLCNSAGIFIFANQAHDYVRPGLSLYGISPFCDLTSKDLGLKPVMTLQSSLISVHDKKKGDSLGYGARYICHHDMRVGVIAFGYGDGYPISAQDGTPVLVNKTRCPLVGRVSMDMMMVDLTACPQAEIGDTVTLWGTDLLLEEVVQFTNEIPWSMLTSIQNRVKFLWT